MQCVEYRSPSALSRQQTGCRFETKHYLLRKLVVCRGRRPLSCNPALLIADEPTTAVDVTTQAQILELLEEFQNEFGMAIMLITHDLGVVAEMADDVVVMYLGRVVERGDVDSIFHDPKHPYTQAPLKSIPDWGSVETCKDWIRFAAWSPIRTTGHLVVCSGRAVITSCRAAVTPSLRPPYNWDPIARSIACCMKMSRHRGCSSWARARLACKEI